MNRTLTQMRTRTLDWDRLWVVLTASRRALVRGGIGSLLAVLGFASLACGEAIYVIPDGEGSADQDDESSSGSEDSDESDEDSDESDEDHRDDDESESGSDESEDSESSTDDGK